MRRGLFTKSRTIGLLVVVWGAFLSWVVWGYLVIRMIERPPAFVIEHRGTYELRIYEPLLVAQVQMRGPWSRSIQEGMQSFSGYLAGENSTQSSVAATIVAGVKPRVSNEYISPGTPFMVEERNDSFLVSVILPSRYGLTTVPLPDNPEIRLVQVASSTAAVLSFSGSADRDTVTRKAGRLKSLLEADHRVILSPARLIRYTSPWTPEFLRQNEVIYTVRE